MIFNTRLLFQGDSFRKLQKIFWGILKIGG